MIPLKTTLLALMIAAAPYGLLAQPTVAGNWDVTFDTPQGPNTITVTLQQDGEKVSGSLSSPFGSVPLTGTVTEEQLQLVGSAEVLGQKQEMHVRAKFEGEGFAGTVVF